MPEESPAQAASQVLFPKPPPSAGSITITTDDPTETLNITVQAPGFMNVASILHAALTRVLPEPEPPSDRLLGHLIAVLPQVMAVVTRAGAPSWPEPPVAAEPPVSPPADAPPAPAPGAA